MTARTIPKQEIRREELKKGKKKKKFPNFKLFSATKVMLKTFGKYHSTTKVLFGLTEIPGLPLEVAV